MTKLFPNFYLSTNQSSIKKYKLHFLYQLSDNVGRSLYVSIINKHGPTGVLAFHSTNIMCMVWCALKHIVSQKNFQVTFYKEDNEPAGNRLVVMVQQMPGLGMCYFFLCMFAFVKLLLPEPDCAQISSPWSFCMGFHW